jgi:hypothetical protein
MADTSTFVFELKESIPGGGGKTPSAQNAVTPPPMPPLSPAAPGQPWSRPVHPAGQAAAPNTSTKHQQNNTGAKVGGGVGGKVGGKAGQAAGTEAEGIIASLFSKGIGSTVGKVAGGAVGDLLGSVVPGLGNIIGTAIGVFVGSQLGKAVDGIIGAFGKVGRAADQAAEKLKPFSAALMVANADISVKTTLRNMERAGRMGGAVANYETAKNDLGYTLQRMMDLFLKPGLQVLTGIMRLTELFVQPLVNFLQWMQTEFYNMVSSAFELMNKMLGGLPGFFGTWFKKLWEKLFGVNTANRNAAWTQFWGLAP